MPDQDRARLATLQKGVKGLRGGSCTTDQHAALAQRGMPIRRDQDEDAGGLYGCGQGQGQRNDPSLGAAVDRELRGLGYVFAEDQLALQRVPQPRLLQGLPGRTALGGVVRIGDGDFGHLTGPKRSRQTRQRSISAHRRAGRREYPDPAGPIQGA